MLRPSVTREWVGKSELPRERTKIKDGGGPTMCWQRPHIERLCDFRGVIDPLISWRENIGHKRGRGGGECEFNYLTTAVESSWEPRGELQLKQKIKDSAKGEEMQRLLWLR
ncbi:hypothetical protein BHE74_00038433 [Ensete ventricosum]|nr:hypothetical protein BHE74_00038433 [Ensete ventricosum]